MHSTGPQLGGFGRLIDRRAATFHLTCLAALLLMAVAAPLGATPERPLLVNGHDASDAPELSRSPAVGELFLIRDMSGKLNARRVDVEADAGVRIHAYLPPDAFLASVSPTTNDDEARAAEERLSRWVADESGRYRLTAFDPSWKIDAKVHLDLDARLSAAVGDDTAPPPQALAVIYGTGTRLELVEALAPLGLKPWSSAEVSVSAVTIGEDAARLRDLLPQLVETPEVLSVEIGGTRRLTNDYANLIVQTGSDKLIEPLRPVWDQGITGEGEVVAIYDMGADFDHCLLREVDNLFPPEVIGTGIGSPDYSRRKIVSYNHVYETRTDLDPAADYDETGHGTQIAAVIAGNPVDADFLEDAGSGLAPNAKLIIQDFLWKDFNGVCTFGTEGCPTSEEYEFVAIQAYEQGARVHSNSWQNSFSVDLGDHYTISALVIDDFVWNRRDMLFTGGVGNSGHAPSTVTSPGSAKNLLGVGASGSPLENPVHPDLTDAPFDGIMPFSSRGPSGSLGQIKPDLVAPGTIRTAHTDNDVRTENCDTIVVSGTSFSGPIVAASATLLRDYLKQGFYPSGSASVEDAITSPSAALLKATLIAGASDMPGVEAFAPNLDEGWGRVNLERTMAFGDAIADPRRLILFDEPASFETIDDEPLSFLLEILPTEESGMETRTRIMLVWSDPAASHMAETTYMVNDLDLVVTDLDTSEVYAGNAFDPETGLSAVDEAADEYNNVEGVFLDSPQAGAGVQPRRFLVEVRPRRLIEGPQTFAIAVSGHVQQLVLPTSGVMAR